MIRPAAVEDVPAMVQMGRRMHDESPRWRALTYDDAKATQLIEALIESPHGFAYVAAGEGGIYGLLIAVAEEHWACSEVIAHELALFVEKDRRGGMAAARLITHLVAWSKSVGAARLVAGASTGIGDDEVIALYERCGFSRCSTGLEIAHV